jgi:hypothetical protein
MLALVGPTSALAAAETYTESIRIPFELYVYVPCAAAGAGEDVYLSGNLHTQFHVTYDSGGGIHISYLANPQGINGYGLTTGAKYQATGETRDTFNARIGLEETYVNNFKIIGQGPGNNFLIHETFHVTLNPNGLVTAYVDNFSVECR